MLSSFLVLLVGLEDSSEPLNLCPAVYTSSVGSEVTIAIVFASLWPMFSEARAALGGKEDTFRALPW